MAEFLISDVVCNYGIFEVGEKMKECKYQGKAPKGYECKCLRNGSLRRDRNFCPFFKLTLLKRFMRWLNGLY